MIWEVVQCYLYFGNYCAVLIQAAMIDNDGIRMKSRIIVKFKSKSKVVTIKYESIFLRSVQTEISRLSAFPGHPCIYKLRGDVFSKI